MEHATVKSIKFSRSLGALRPDLLLDRAVDGVGRIASHEAESLDGHWLALRERWAVARRARGVGELLRDQLDLLPQTRSRMLHDHRVRLDLWRGLAQTLKAGDESPPHH